VTVQKYLVLAGVALFASAGDSLLSRGMKDIGGISLHNLSALISAVRDPWIILGILFLIAFFAAYMAALSWADLTYVLPATSIGYVVLALIAKFILHEQVTLLRWVGILLISAGVSFVAGGPVLTAKPGEPAPAEDALEPMQARSRS
jgi:drug/metabolite transporter (DMT)-like permease